MGFFQEVGRNIVGHNTYKTIHENYVKALTNKKKGRILRLAWTLPNVENQKSSIFQYYNLLILNMLW